MTRVQPKIPQILAAAGCLFRPKTIEKLRHFSFITMYARKSFISDTATDKKGLQALIFLQILCIVLSFECIALLSYDFFAKSWEMGAKKFFFSVCTLTSEASQQAAQANLSK